MTALEVTKNTIGLSEQE